ncbi:MAG: primosomal protein N' [Sumerlaeia bacterium]
MQYAHVVLKNPLQQAFTYIVPPQYEGKLTRGMLVVVPWRSKHAVGLVDSVSQDDQPGEVNFKVVSKIASPQYMLSDSILSLCSFASAYYCCSFGEMTAAASMVGFSDVGRQEKRFELADDLEVNAAVGLTPKQRQGAIALKNLALNQPYCIAELARLAGVSASIINQLTLKGVLRLVDLEGVAKKLRAPAVIFDERFLPLNPEQGVAYQQISPALVEHHFQATLLYGVTGSGKTEVYLHLMRDALRLGGTALCLVPEISLTPQTLARFEERFGPCVGLFHSQMTRLQKLDLYHQLQAGTMKIVLGARSALFSDLPDCQIIIVDEEHESTYKQNESPRYNARDLAVFRAKQLSIPVVLGSATPSLESWHNAMQGKYTLLRLRERATNQPLSPVEVIDLGEEIRETGKVILLTDRLLSEMKFRYNKGEQSLLFLNRRGWTNFLFCPSCNWVGRCPDDDVTLTVHRKRKGKPEVENDLFAPDEESTDEILKCHFCGGKHPLPQKCPDCHSEKLARVGLGTQRVEEKLLELFDEKNIMRVDQDSVSSRTQFIEAWQRMAEEKVPIILGTQMIAKGLHLENVTLVGVILADVGLYQPDFRAAERVFQLLTQVAGRSGREKAGVVLFQTYLPRHQSIRSAQNHDPESFYEWELRNREKLQFPPFAGLALITTSDPDREKAYSAARALGFHLRKIVPNFAVSYADSIKVFGPNVPPIARAEGRYRYRIMLRGPKNTPFGKIIRIALDHASTELLNSTRCLVDIDPYDFS